MQVFIEYEFITVFIHSCQEKKTENGTVKMVGVEKGVRMWNLLEKGACSGFYSSWQGALT